MFTNGILFFYYPVAGGHAASDQRTGAAKGGGETEGESKRKTDKQSSGASEKQVFEIEGRRRERILLLFQRKMTEKRSSSFLHVSLPLPDPAAR